MWWEELVGLVCWLHLFVGTLSKKNLSLCLGPLCLSFCFERAGRGADLERQP